MLVGDPHTRASRLVAAVGAHVLRECALASRDAGVDLAEEPERLAEAVERLGAAIALDHRLERRPGRLPLAPFERTPAFRDSPRAGQRAHGAVILEHVAAGIARQSVYGAQLREAQKLKVIYGVCEQQFHRYLQAACRRQDATPGEASRGVCSGVPRAPRSTCRSRSSS
jgi:Ribosomal protein S4/S9 N-terminal domain